MRYPLILLALVCIGAVEPEWKPLPYEGGDDGYALEPLPALRFTPQVPWR